MSLVIVKASAITIYQNQTTATGDLVNDQAVDSSNNNLSQFQARTSEFITTEPKTKHLSFNNDHPQVTKDNLTITNHIIRTHIIVGAEGAAGESGGLQSSNLKENLSKSSDNMRAKLQQLLQRENENDDEEKQQLQQQDLQQQHLQEQQFQLQQQQQQRLYQQSQHAMLAGENAYLLERIDGGSMHEQPIYGTWSAKARRPQAPLLAATAATSTSTTTTTTSSTLPSSAQLQPSSSIQTLFTEVDENFYGRFNNPKQQQQQQQQYHHYERLPRRSSTMTPVRRELHDQIPRPPRLTSRQPSLALRRQFSETPQAIGSFRDESKPKPFHYPFEGPMPEEFRKQQTDKGLESETQVHNIQDILQKLNLGTPATKVPPLMMMPSGLHISGSFKNFKSSGIGNFFRGKRHKKQIQMQFPMPIPLQMMTNPYQQPLIMQQPYQQRIAMEQFYPFKARSPGEINLLAMQQQQQMQQHKQKNPGSKGKKKNKKNKDKKNSLASSNVMMQQYPFVTAAPEMVFPSMYSPFMSINVTQAPPLQMSKRVPFKVNLDIFPVMPPNKNFKSPAGYAMDEARIVSTMRPPTVLRNPFMEYLTTPLTPSAAALQFYNPYNQKQPAYNPIRFPTGSPNPLVSMAQTNTMQMVYPEQMQKYLQQQQNQQQQNLFNNFLSNQGHQTPFLPIDCEQPMTSASGSQAQSSGNTKTNPIMVHLNVFPKQKSSTPLSTNPFYSNTPQIQRNTIHEESETSLGSIEPRHQGRALNDSSPTKIERSDSSENIQHIQPIRSEDDLVDFDHPIVAENSEDNNELPQPEALVGAKSNNATPASLSSSFYYESRPNATVTSSADSTNTNYNGNLNGNMEQMVSEAKTASLFRFPVEDLIQFQVHDAM